MLKIHQPYIKRIRYLALANIGVLLLGSLIIVNLSSESSEVSAAEIKYMQQFTNPICQSMKSGETMDLIDPRGESEKDFQTYTIVKIKDKRCWMQENLKLNAKADVGLLLTPNDTNTIDDWTLPRTLIGSESTVSGWIDDNTSPYSASFNNATHEFYYNWCASTAGSCNTIDDGVALDSICPRGWRLPTGDSAGDFEVLNGLTADAVLERPYMYKRAGYIYASKLTSFDAIGSYWSSTGYSGKRAAVLQISSSVSPGESVGYRRTGYPIRCIADNTVTESDFTYEGDIDWKENKDGDVIVNVPSILTIDAVSSFEDTMPESHLLEGSISATIFSNTEYNVMLNANTDAALVSEDNSRIEPVSDSNEVKAGNNAWGFWDGKSNPKLYTVPLSTAMTEIPNAESNGENDSTIHTYYLGISIAPSLPSGVYATDVTVTASVK